MAVAQLLEYQFLLAEAGDSIGRLAMLLPALPGPDLLRWLSHLDIGVAYPDGDGFCAWPDSTVFDPEASRDRPGSPVPHLLWEASRRSSGEYAGFVSAGVGRGRPAMCGCVKSS